MAICESSKRSLIRLSFCIIFVVLGIVQNCYARTTMTAYAYRTIKVDMCPQNETEWEEASRRLNCSDDAKNPFNRYHCLPVHDLTTLMEFCYNMTRPQVVKGLCMTYVQGINILDSYNCTAFDDGCPDMFYLSDESYKFPACLEIDPFGRCYVAESSCRSKTTPSIFATSTNRTTNNKLTMSLTLFLPYMTLLLLPLIVSVIYILKRRECKQKDKSHEEVPPLRVLDEKTKDEIAEFGFEYILDKLPTDSSEYSLIAKEYFAGQSAYYACHHIFFSPRAFFILVVDMSNDLDKAPTQACNEPDLIYSSWTYADYIRYWLGSIHTYSSPTAPVILAASHSGNTGKKELLEYYLKICPLLPDQLRHHIHQERIFSVEKEHNKNINDLKRCIVSTLTSLDHWGENVPIAWNKLEYVLRTKSKKAKVYSFPDLQKEAGIADEIFMNCKEDLITALKFFNDTGLILFRKEIQNENENVVILDVKWFVDAFKRIIMDGIHLDQTTYNNDNFKDFNNLYRNGLLSLKLLNTLWDDSDLNFYKRNLVEHMKHLYMLAELEPELWYVPCMNKQKYNESVLDNCNVSSTLCFVFKFLPFDIYHRLIAACIYKLKMELWKLDKYCIYHTVTILKCKSTTHRLIIGIGKEEKDDKYPYSIEIQAIETKPRNPDIQFCYKVKENITQILLELTRTFKSSGAHFQVGYLCTKTPHKDPPQGHIILEDALKKKDLDCYECKPVHVVDGKFILGFWENGRFTGNDDMEASIPFPEAIDEDQYDIKTSISSSYNRDILSENEDSQSNGYGMEQIHKDALRRTRVMLVTNLDVDIIYDELLGKDIFTPLMMEYIKNERTRIDKVRRLLDDLPRRGSNAYHDFLKVLWETGYKYLANEIVGNEEIIRREKASKRAKAEIHTSLIFDKSKPNTAVESPLVTSEILNLNPTTLESFGPSSTFKYSSESVLPATRAEASNDQPHPGGLVVHEKESDT